MCPEFGVNVVPSRLNNVQVYRRFQMTFLSSPAALEFIDAIRTICPCKANPAPAPAPKPMNPPSSLPDPLDLHPNSFTVRSAPIASASQPLFSSSQTSLVTPFPPTVFTSSPLNIESNISMAPFSSLPLSSLPASGFDISGISPNPITNKKNGVPVHLQTASAIANYPSGSSLPNSSPPTSSSRSINDNNMTVNVIPGRNTASALLDALSETTVLYDLPQSELEQLVGEVVREEGFTKLVCHLLLQSRIVTKTS